MMTRSAMHQKPEKSGRAAERQGEALPETERDEARLSQQGVSDSGQSLLMQALARENIILAWQRVKANRGSAGVDGLSITETEEHLKTRWPQIREGVLNGHYRPQPVRRVQIPKPDGGQREN